MAELLDWDINDKAVKGKIATIYREWKGTGVLSSEIIHDARQGREVSIVTVGERISLHDL
jgi:hypothetical protein